MRKAGVLLGAAGAIRQVSQSARLPEEQEEYDQEIAQFKNLPEAEIFEAACAQGSRMTMEEATGYSLNEISSRV